MKEEVLAKLDFHGLVSEYVSLKPSGRDKFKGLSPFSKERTPSFYIDTAKGVWYCFSTKQGGGPLDFLMKVEGLSFRDALEKLAARTGVVLESRAQDRHRRDLYEICDLAVAYYREQLAADEGAEALAYLQRRQVSPEVMERFAVGWAPNSFDSLLKHAKARGVSERELTQAGLLASSPDTGRVYDRFRARVMFPIRDYLGRVVAFGGRVLDDSKPKYLNSPETEIFKKHDTLYGLDTARKVIAETGEAVIVEGYMDVLAMHQHGFHSAVASLGTALGVDHAHLLARQGARRLALFFDNDAAGLRATLAGLDQEIGRMFLVRAATPPGGKDAADILLQEGGEQAIQDALTGGLSEVEFRFAATLARHDPNTLDGKQAILNELLPQLRPRDVFDPVALELRRLVEGRLSLKAREVDEWINAQKRRTGQRLSGVQVTGMTANAGAQRGELRLAQLLVSNPALAASIDAGAGFGDPLVEEVVRVARASHSSAEVLEHFVDRPDASKLFEGLFAGPEDENADAAAVSEIISRRREARLKDELSGLKLLIEKAAPGEQEHLFGLVVDMQRAVEAERRSRLRGV